MLLRMFLIKSREPQFRNFQPVPIFVSSGRQMAELAERNNWRVLRELNPNGFDLEDYEDDSTFFDIDSTD